MNIVVCPFCQTGFRIKVKDKKCPQCGNEFNSADWPIKEVFLSIGKIPRLTVSWGDTNTWSPVTTDFLIGREPGLNGLQLNEGHVSREHAHVVLRDGCWIIESLGKEVTVNDTDLGDFPNSSVELVSGDKITIWAFQLKVRVDYTADFTFSQAVESVQAGKQDIALSRDNPVHIGSDQAKCLLVIPNASPDHAAVYYHKPSKSWWIADMHSGSGTRVNGSSVCNERLVHGDKITIGDTDILFDSEYLRTGRNPNAGVNVSIRDVTVSRGEGNPDILSHINMEVHAGEFVGLLGPSGCGKSSLIQRLAGLGSFDAGKVLVNFASYESRKKDIQSITAYVPQDVALHEDLKLKEEISIFCRLHFKNISIDQQVQNALRLVGLDGKRDDRIGDLSGGEKRRASIALELLREPQLFLLDEPTAGLDPATETDIMKYLRRVANQNRTVICSTHIMGNIRLFDKVLFISKGKEVFYGTPSDLLARFDTDSPLKIYQIFGKEDTPSEPQKLKTKKGKKRESLFSRFINQLNTLFRSIKTLFPRKAGGTCSNLNLSSSTPTASLLQQILGYLQRQLLDYFSFRHQEEWKEKFKSFIFSPFFIQILLLPVLVAFVLKTACADSFSCARKDLFFFSAIAVFWFGLNTHIRELVKERTPWRCLERLEHISLFSYLSAKIIWTILISLVQIFMFLLSYVFFHWFFEFLFEVGGKITGNGWFVSLIRECVMSFRSLSAPVTFKFSFTYSVILYFCCILGSWISLAVSSIFKKENSAVGLLPIILIPFLFFSEPIVNTGLENSKPVPHAGRCECQDCNGEKEKHYCTFAVYIQRISPLYAASLLMEKQLLSEEQSGEPRKKEDQNNNDEGKKSLLVIIWQWLIQTKLGCMFLTTGIYMSLALGLMTFFQHRNEQKWEGR